MAASRKPTKKRKRRPAGKPTPKVSRPARRGGFSFAAAFALAHKIRIELEEKRRAEEEQKKREAAKERKRKERARKARKKRKPVRPVRGSRHGARRDVEESRDDAGGRQRELDRRDQEPSPDSRRKYEETIARERAEKEALREQLRAKEKSEVKAVEEKEEAVSRFRKLQVVQDENRRRAYDRINELHDQGLARGDMGALDKAVLQVWTEFPEEFGSLREIYTLFFSPEKF